jgi:hypothetical protein
MAGVSQANRTVIPLAARDPDGRAHRMIWTNVALASAR